MKVTISKRGSSASTLRIKKTLIISAESRDRGGAAPAPESPRSLREEKLFYVPVGVVGKRRRLEVAEAVLGPRVVVGHGEVYLRQVLRPYAHRVPVVLLPLGQVHRAGGEVDLLFELLLPFGGGGLLAGEGVIVAPAREQRVLAQDGVGRERRLPAQVDGVEIARGVQLVDDHVGVERLKIHVEADLREVVFNQRSDVDPVGAIPVRVQREPDGVPLRIFRDAVAVAVEDADLSEQLPGLLRVVGVLHYRVAVPDLVCGRVEAIDGDAPALERRPHHAFTVERVGDRLPELHVAKPLQLDGVDVGLALLVFARVLVERQVVQVHRRAEVLDRVVARGLSLLEEIDRVRADRGDHVRFAVLELERSGVEVRHDLKYNAVDIRQSLFLTIDLPEVRVALQHDALVRRERREPVGADADDLFRVGTDGEGLAELARLVIGFQLVFRDYVDAVGGGYEDRVRLFQLEPDRVVVDLLDFRVRPVGLSERARGGGLFLVVERYLVGEHYIVGRERRAVGPLHALSQIESPGEPVRGSLPALRQRRYVFLLVVVVIDEPSV